MKAKQIVNSIGDYWSQLVCTKSPNLLYAIVALNFGLTLLTEFLTLQNFPNSGDEYAYLVSAEILSRGQLSVPSPPLREFFDIVHVVNDGKYYGKYPPGWPFLLAIGSFFNVPWLINPLLGALTLIVIYHLARRHFSLELANIVLFICMGNPYFVFNSASYFSHSSCLLFACLFLFCLFNCSAKHDDWKSYLGLGVSAGLTFAIRPFTAVAFFLPCIILFLCQCIRDKRFKQATQGLVLAAIPFSISMALFLAYNWAQTGNALLQPFQKYDPSDVPSLPKTEEEWTARLNSHVLARLWELNRWLPLSVIFLLLACARRGIRQDPKLRMCLLTFWTLFVAFFCYWGDGIVQYGPRYLYESLGALLLVCAAVVSSFGRAGLLMVLGVLTLSISTFVYESREVSQEIAGNREVHRVVGEHKLSNAIVFLRPGAPVTTGPMWGPRGNVINFDAPVLIVRDRANQNALLLQKHPKRTGYYYDYDPSLKKGRILRMETGRSER